MSTGGRARASRRLLGLACAFVLTTPLGGLIPASANQPTDGLHHHRIVDSFGEGITYRSFVYTMPDTEIQKVIDNTGSPDLAQRVQCFDLNSDDCKAPRGLSMRVYLPRCSADRTSLCIEGLSVSAAEGTPLIDATYLRDQTVDLTFAPDAARGFPGGFAPTQWRAAGTKNAGGTDTYVVKLLLDAYLTSTSSSLAIFDVSASVEGFAGTDDHRVDFADGQRVALVVRLPNTLTGWLNGRLRNSGVEVTKIDNTQNRLRVEADPVTVPEVNVALTDAQFNSLPNPSYFAVFGETWDSVNAGNMVAFEWLKQLSGVMKDTSSGEHTAWNYSTITNRSNNNCLADRTRVAGLVTTNAAVYEPDAPMFTEGALNYRVGGLHFRPDGKSLTIGTYDLLIRSDIARCLYGFSSAPLSATVSVTTATGGEQVVATSTLSERDGWLHLAAAGFTFSSPTIRVKLQQQSSTESAPKPSVKRTLVCTKGKLIKKVTSAKCPTGWKSK